MAALRALGWRPRRLVARGFLRRSPGLAELALRHAGPGRAAAPSASRSAGAGSSTHASSLAFSPPASCFSRRMSRPSHRRASSSSPIHSGRFAWTRGAEVDQVLLDGQVERVGGYDRSCWIGSAPAGWACLPPLVRGPEGVASTRPDPAVRQVRVRPDPYLVGCCRGRRDRIPAHRSGAENRTGPGPALGFKARASVLACEAASQR